MSSRSRLITRSIVLMLLLGTASAAHAARVTVGLHGGLNRLVEDYGDFPANASGGYQASFFSELALDSSNTIGLEATRVLLGDMTTALSIFGNTFVFKQEPKLFEALLFFRHTLPLGTSGFAPYLKAGAGATWVANDGSVTFGDRIETVSVASTHMGSAFGVGMEVRVGERAGLRFEGLFHQIETPAKDQFITLGLAWTWRFGS